MWLGFTDKYSIHYRGDKVTIYDKRMNDHLPFTFDGEDAKDFRETLTLLPGLIKNDDELYREIDKLCEKAKEESTLRR